MNEKRWWKDDIEEFSKKSKKKKKKTLLHGFHFHYEAHNWRNLTAQEKNKGSAAWWCEWKGRGGKTGDNEDFINQHWSSAVRLPRHCWSHYQFRCWDVLKNVWLCKLSHLLSRRDNRPSHTPRAGVLWGGRGRGAGGKKQNNGWMSSHAAAAGEISRRFAWFNQFGWAE